MRPRRLLVPAGIAVFLSLATLFVWPATGWPPLRVLLTCRPVSGETAQRPVRRFESAGGSYEFVRVEPGYTRVRRGTRGTFTERLFHGLGVRKLAWMSPRSARIDRYVWVDRPFWISRQQVPIRAGSPGGHAEPTESRFHFATVDEVYLAYGTGALPTGEYIGEQALRKRGDLGSLKWIHPVADPADKIYWRQAFLEIEDQYGSWPRGRLVWTAQNP